MQSREETTLAPCKRGFCLQNSKGDTDTMAFGIENVVFIM